MHAPKLAAHGMVLGKSAVAVHVAIMRKTLRELGARFDGYSAKLALARESPAGIDPKLTDVIGSNRAVDQGVHLHAASISRDRAVAYL